MGRVMGFIALAVVIGVATGLVLHRVVVGMLVGGGVLLWELSSSSAEQIGSDFLPPVGAGQHIERKEELGAAPGPA
jgi:hypothetical protein